MKNIFRLAAIAIVSLSLTVACKSKAPEAMEEDTLPMEMIEEVIDSTLEEVAEEVVVEEPVKKATTTTKKKEKSVQTKSTEVDNSVPSSTLPSTAQSNAKKGNITVDNTQTNTLPATNQAGAKRR